MRGRSLFGCVPRSLAVHFSRAKVHLPRKHFTGGQAVVPTSRLSVWECRRLLGKSSRKENPRRFWRSGIQPSRCPPRSPCQTRNSAAFLAVKTVGDAVTQDWAKSLIMTSSCKSHVHNILDGSMIMAGAWAPGGFLSRVATFGNIRQVGISRSTILLSREGMCGSSHWVEETIGITVKVPKRSCIALARNLRDLQPLRASATSVCLTMTQRSTVLHSPIPDPLPILWCKPSSSRAFY